MTLTTTETLDVDTKIQYLCTLVCVESFRMFELLATDVENTETLNVDYYIKGLALYLFPMKLLSKQRCAVRHGIKKRAV